MTCSSSLVNFGGFIGRDLYYVHSTTSIVRRRHGRDALATIIDAYIKDRRPIPMPSARKTRWSVTLPALVEAKVRLYETMRTNKVTKAELGRRLKWHLPQVDRLLAMTHGSQMGQVEAAFAALGKRLVVSVDDAAPVRPPTRQTKRSTPRRIAGRGAKRRMVVHR